MKKSISAMLALLAGFAMAQSPQYTVTIVPGTDGTVSITKNGEPVDGYEFQAGEDDTVVVTATANAGKRFVQWKGNRTSLDPDSHLGNASVTLHPKAATTLTAHWVTPKTRRWNPTKKTVNSGNGQSFYYFITPENWLDDNNATGMPRIGDTVLFGMASVSEVSGAYRLSDLNADNPLYEVRYVTTKGINGMNQGSFALLAGGNGLQYLRTVDSGSNWSGISCVGDGIVPVNIANHVAYVMQKGCQALDYSGYTKNPIVVKQGLGTVINYCQSGGYTYNIPTTIIQEGRWDITMTTSLPDCVIMFDGDAAKQLTFCYASYSEDLPFNGGGICEKNGAANHKICANNKKRNVIFKGNPKFNPMVFSGQFCQGAGLTWSPNNAANVFVCSNAVSDTQGNMKITKGTVKLVAGASFTNLSELDVSAGAALEVEEGSGEGLRAESVVLGSTAARLKLASGVTLAATTVTLAGQALKPGTYAATAGSGVRAAAWIEGDGTVTVAEGPGNTATWNGSAGASTQMNNAANWADGEVPDFATGDLLATFATGGAEARLSGAAGFSGIALNNAFGGNAFTFAADGGANATIGALGINVAAAAADTTWMFGWPIALSCDQTWVNGEKNTLKLDGGLSGAAALTINNSGTVHLNGSNTLGKSFEVVGGTVRVTASNAFGPADRTFAMHHSKTKYVFDGNLVFDNVMYSGDIIRGSNPFMSVEAGSHVTFNKNFGWMTDGNITFGANSVTVFNGGFKCITDGMEGKFLPRGSGTMIVSNANISACRSVQGAGGHPVTIELCVQNNALNDSSYWAQLPVGRLVTRVTQALQKAALISFDDTTFDLCGTVQEIALIATTAKTKIISDEPATLIVNSPNDGSTSMSGSMGGDSRVNYAAFGGRVSFRKTGPNPHTFGAVSSTTGSVTVANGTLTFNADAAWPNATEVAVTGGTLALKNAQPFGEDTVWRVTTGGTIDLNFDGTGYAGKLVVDGKRVPGGIYGATGSGAEKEVAWLTGTGRLRVISDGTVVVIR